jgi:hypothetical protein
MHGLYVQGSKMFLFTVVAVFQDELLGSPEASLKSLGLRSGDLLWVMAESTHVDASPSETCVPETASNLIAPPEDNTNTAAEEQLPSMMLNTSCPLEALRWLVHAALLDSGLDLLQVCCN